LKKYTPKPCDKFYKKPKNALEWTFWGVRRFIGMKKYKLDATIRERIG
jgi:hypothetical protein